MLIILIGCKEEAKCNVLIYSNGTAIFEPFDCKPDFGIPLDEIPDNVSISSAELYLIYENETELPPKNYYNVTYEKINGT